MLEKIAIIDKAPSRNNYSKYFDFDFELFHMSSIPITKLLKKDVDLEIDLDYYDLVILVGSEAAKEYAKVTSVTNYAGILIKDKFVCLTNPAGLIFKPEGEPDFKRAVDKINSLILQETISSSDKWDFKGITDSEEALQYLQEVLSNAHEIITLDTETTSLYPRDGYVLGLSITYKPKQGRYILTDILDLRHEKLLKEICDTYEVVFHNIKFDYKMLKYHLDMDFDRNRVHDTMLLHYVLDENESHGLKQLALKYTDYGDYDAELTTFKKQYCSQHNMLEEDFTYDLIPFDILSKYAAIDTAVTFELYQKFWPIVNKNSKLLWVYKNLLLRGSLFLMDMEETGIPINKAKMKLAEEYLNNRIQIAKEEIYKFNVIKDFERDNDKIFNPNSVKQLRTVLFDYLKLTPTGKLTATGALSTDAEVLEELSEVHDLPKAILTVRQLGKMKNTYISKILPEIDKDGRIRTNFNLIFTTSGRLSSSGKFNAQQIPRDDPIIKGCIQAPEGYKIVSQDLVTGEMYYAAVLSKDKNLQEVFKIGEDFHSTIAKMVFNLAAPIDLIRELFNSLRQSAKAISFGILYGSGAKKVAETVSKSSGEEYPVWKAQEDIDAYFSKFSRLKAWLEERKQFIKANGYTYSFFGRKRRLPNVFSADKSIASHEIRSGINAEIQSLCSDINLLGAMDADEEIKKKSLDASIFMLVHDSIVALVKDEYIEEYKEIIKRCIQKDRGCSISGFPIGVDQEVSQDYSFGKFDKVYAITDNMLVKQ